MIRTKSSSNAIIYKLIRIRIKKAKRFRYVKTKLKLKGELSKTPNSHSFYTIMDANLLCLMLKELSLSKSHSFTVMRRLFSYTLIHSNSIPHYNVSLINCRRYAQQVHNISFGLLLLLQFVCLTESELF